MKSHRYSWLRAVPWATCPPWLAAGGSVGDLQTSPGQPGHHDLALSMIEAPISGYRYAS